MSKNEFKEGNLTFIFHNWKNVIKFDKHVDYKKVSNLLPHTEGVDFLAYKTKRVCFIEVKDFRTHRVASKEKLTEKGAELMIEVGQKVKGTLSCIAAGSRNSTNDSDLWKSIMECIKIKGNSVFVILWLEQDETLNLNQQMQDRYKASIQIYKDTLKTKLSWLTTKVDIRNKLLDNADIGISVENI